MEQGLAIVLSGLSNTMAIQSNLDWVWPMWVERQLDPDGEEFIPTAINLIESNLTARNWTSLGVEDRSRRHADPATLAGCERIRIREQAYPDGAPKAREGIVIRHGDTLPHGLRTTCYPGGRRESAEAYVDGYLQGYALRWHPNGRLRSVEHFSDGERDGQAKYWDEDGSLAGCYDGNARDCLLACSRDPEPERLVSRPDGAGPENLLRNP